MYPPCVTGEETEAPSCLVQGEAAAAERPGSQVLLSPEASFQALGMLPGITHHSFIPSSSLVLKIKWAADWA